MIGLHIFRNFQETKLNPIFFSILRLRVTRMKYVISLFLLLSEIDSMKRVERKVVEKVGPELNLNKMEKDSKLVNKDFVGRKS